jgi:hypothetical protein
MLHCLQRQGLHNERNLFLIFSTAWLMTALLLPVYRTLQTEPINDTVVFSSHNSWRFCGDRIQCNVPGADSRINVWKLSDISGTDSDGSGTDWHFRDWLWHFRDWLTFQGLTLTFQELTDISGTGSDIQGLTLTLQGLTLTFQWLDPTFQGVTLTFQGLTLTFQGLTDTSGTDSGIQGLTDISGTDWHVRDWLRPYWMQDMTFSLKEHILRRMTTYRESYRNTNTSQKIEQEGWLHVKLYTAADNQYT